ncbi:hypothetical protein KP509_17G084100 [Ceratopteris richardii]|uniref:Uncharacterized protein n=1 Tax=Ceratopteris richardii TaxID=49495 RepID=A0A8T2SW54_CERRI|nr:hypothetical protein KP509_17G084100 [Ceratopteris richardii]
MWAHSPDSVSRVAQHFWIGEADYVDLGNDSEFKSEPNSSLAFNDPAFADVVLSFHSSRSSDTNIYAITRVFLHSHILEQCKSFAAILLERWRDSCQFSGGPNHKKRIHIDMNVRKRLVECWLPLLDGFREPPSQAPSNNFKRTS